MNAHFTTSDTYWFALQVLPQQELLSKLFLEQRGVDCFVPLKSVWRKPNKKCKRKVEKFYPEVPGYCFIKVPMPFPYATINSVRPVRHIIGYSDEALMHIPAVLNPEYMEKWRSRDAAGAVRAATYERHMRTKFEFKPGDKVQIDKAGPFDGHVVTVRQIRGHNAMFLAEAFGQTVPIIIPLTDLEKAA